MFNNYYGYYIPKTTQWNKQKGYCIRENAEKMIL